MLKCANVDCVMWSTHMTRCRHCGRAAYCSDDCVFSDSARHIAECAKMRMEDASALAAFNARAIVLCSGALECIDDDDDDDDIDTALVFRERASLRMRPADSVAVYQHIPHPRGIECTDWTVRDVMRGIETFEAMMCTQRPRGSRVRLECIKRTKMGLEIKWEETTET